MSAVADSALSVPQAVETIPKLPFLFWAYALIFAVILGYLVTIHLRQRRLNREIAALERRIGQEK